MGELGGKAAAKISFQDQLWAAPPPPLPPHADERLLSEIQTYLGGLYLIWQV